MAGRPRKDATITNEKEVKVDDIEITSEVEVEEIEETVIEVEETVEVEQKTDPMIEQLMKQMAEMQEQLTKTQEEKTTLSQLLEVMKTDKVNSNEEYSIDFEVPVISHCVGNLNLYTEGKGNGNVFRYREFGEEQNIPYGELRSICKSNKAFAEKGLFYILDSEIVKKLGLSQHYNRMLNNDKMMSLKEMKKEEVQILYDLANDSQKEIIVEYLKSEYETKGEGSLDILVVLGQLCGKNLIG